MKIKQRRVKILCFFEMFNKYMFKIYFICSCILKKDKAAREKIRTYLENPNAFKSLMLAPKEMEMPVFPITEKDIYSLFPNFSRMEIDEVIREFGQRGKILSNLKVDVCENGKTYLEQISLRAATSKDEIENRIANILEKVSGQLTARAIKNKSSKPLILSKN